MRLVSTLTYMETKLEPKRLALTFDRTQEALDLLEKRIRSSRIEYDLLIAPARGGLIPGAVLSHRLGVPVLPIVYQTRDGDGYAPSLSKELIFDLLRAKNVLIIEDIIDSGYTIRCLRTELRRYYADLSVDVAAIIENTAQEQCTVEYSGIQFNKSKEDVWIDFWWEKTNNG